MNGLTPSPLLDPAVLRRQVEARDLQVANPFSKDSQVQGIRNARRFLGDRLVRAAAPHRLLDPAAGPLIAVKLHVLTRKTLGGIQTDLQSRALDLDGRPVPGLYAAGEVAGFGGGGVPRLQRPRGHLPGRLPVQRPGRPGAPRRRRSADASLVRGGSAARSSRLR
jgi:predicted oxidoreductase